MLDVKRKSWLKEKIKTPAGAKLFEANEVAERSENGSEVTPHTTSDPEGKSEAIPHVASDSETGNDFAAQIELRRRSSQTCSRWSDKDTGVGF